MKVQLQMKYFTLKGSSSSKTITYKYTVPETITSDSTISLIFEIVDQDGRRQSTKAKIYLIIFEDFHNAFSCNGLSFQMDNITITNCNAMLECQTGVIRNILYTPAADLDLAYIYHGTGGNVLASPNAPYCETIYNIYHANTYSLVGKNETLIQKVSISSLSEVTVEYLEGLTITSEYILCSAGNGKGTQITAGDFVAFQTADGFKGVIEIKTVQYANKIASNMTCDMRISLETSSGK